MSNDNVSVNSTRFIVCAHHRKNKTKNNPAKHLWNSIRIYIDNVDSQVEQTRQRKKNRNSLTNVKILFETQVSSITSIFVYRSLRQIVSIVNSRTMTDWLIDWSLTALSAQQGYIVPLEVLIVCVLENRNALGVLYISYSVVDDQRHK